MKKIKEFFQVLYWLPEMLCSMWKVKNGRLFVFRNESNAFVRFVVDGISPDGLSHMSRDLQNYYDQAFNEVAARKRMGTWTC